MAAGGAAVTPTTAAVHAVLVEAGLIDDDEFNRPQLLLNVLVAAAIFGTPSPTLECARLLDAHDLAVQHDPDTVAIAARIVQRVKEARD
jgi:hypothetical protein